MDQTACPSEAITRVEELGANQNMPEELDMDEVNDEDLSTDDSEGDDAEELDTDDNTGMEYDFLTVEDIPTQGGQASVQPASDDDKFTGVGSNGVVHEDDELTGVSSNSDSSGHSDAAMWDIGDTVNSHNNSHNKSEEEMEKRHKYGL